MKGHCTVLACPGSGKTRVLSARAAQLLESEPKGRLVAVSFTRDAATELRSRILAACGQKQARRLGVGTFHSLALAQLRRSSSGKMPRLLSEGERLAVLRRCWKAPADISFETAVQAIDAVKARLVPPMFCDGALEAFAQSVQQVMAAEGVMDFSDLLLNSVRGMREGGISPLPIRWLLVDEAQDMDEVQKEWILLHGHAGIEVTLVGDDDQSLYAFRHALGYAGLKDVTIALSATETTLPVNYRCAPNILAHAARLIAHNQERAPKKIEAARKSQGEIQRFRYPDRWAETEQMAEWVAGEAGRENQEWAILGRTNLILDAAECALSNLGISYLRSGGKSIWEYAIGSIFIGLLRSVLDDTWTGMANALSFCGIPADWLNAKSDKGETNPIQRLEGISRQVVVEAERKTLLRLQSGLASWKEQLAKDRPALVVHGIAGFLEDYCKSSQINLLKSMEKTIVRRPGSLAQRLALLGSAHQRRQQAGVHIMTLHAAKGLEFDQVWIMGCEEGNLPHADATEEDERRLLYVGMTRARHRLVLSSAVEEGLESRFLEESGLKG